MSAILGQIEFGQKKVDQQQFIDAFSTLEHFGSGRSNVELDSQWALGIHQFDDRPFVQSAKRTSDLDEPIVIADAILDNREQLAQKLEIFPGELESLSDAQLIKASFQKWGEKCVDHLSGDYAFVALSPQEAKLTLFRDHIGSRPLFWFRREHTIGFGTALEGVIKVGGYSWRIDESVVAEYLAFPITPVSKPFFEGVQSVPPASIVRIYPGGEDTIQWWSPNTRTICRPVDEADAVALVRGKIEEAVTTRCDTSRPIGCHLSGGIDSTAVAMIAGLVLEKRSRKIDRAYTWSPDSDNKYPISSGRDERRYITSLALKLGAPLTFGKSTLNNILHQFTRPMEFESTLGVVDEHPITLEAGIHGTGVFLSGWGGDEAFSPHGHGVIGYYLISGKWRRALRFARNRYNSANKLKFLTKILWRELLHPLLPTFLYYRWHPSKLYRGKDSFASESIKRGKHKLFRHRKRHPRFRLNPKKNCKTLLLYGHIAARMDAWAIWSASSGYQYRYPLTDRSLLEQLFALPVETIFLGDQSRGLARAVMKNLTSEGASKIDPINEEFRKNTRFEVWRALAEQVENGEFQDDCPWIDKQAFLKAASNPRPQNCSEAMVDYLEVYAAARVWQLYRRAKCNGWI